MRFHKGSGVSTRCSWQPASRAYFSSANSDPRLSSGIVFFNPLSPTPLTSTISDLQDSFIFAFTWSLKLGVNVALTFSIFAQMGLVVQRWNFDRRGSFWLEKKEVDTPVSSLSAVWRIHETAAMCNSYLPMVREHFLSSSSSSYYYYSLSILTEETYYAYTCLIERSPLLCFSLVMLTS